MFHEWTVICVDGVIKREEKLKCGARAGEDGKAVVLEPAVGVNEAS